jgi:hypothetical protein
MTVSQAVQDYHIEQAEFAELIYAKSMTSGSAAKDWYSSVAIARKMILQALRATDCFVDLPKGIAANAGHIKVLRHILAPPMSQDQFALWCKSYSKSKENLGSPLPWETAVIIGSVISGGRDKRLARWIERGVTPTSFEIKEVLGAVSPILSLQIMTTIRRLRLSFEQELAVIELLREKGWTAYSTPFIEESSSLPPKHFMHKAKFATKTRPQEVDIACGCGKSLVLAMECKVTNDRTNSVKRVNDILKKATAWQDHWGSFVRTAALLQGVVGYKDVARLLAANVEVFWSHDLDRFSTWIDENAQV